MKKIEKLFYKKLRIENLKENKNLLVKYAQDLSRDGFVKKTLLSLQIS